ncbi:hypothetical protein BJX61DRAFT_541278 [Aspergillus egyptiacus]|nr:hypothetical protein BJX61DRAFT_541278 [Aspergillus egyptiacus]
MRRFTNADRFLTINLQYCNPSTMTKYKQGQFVSFKPHVIPASARERTGTIKQVIVERGNAANRNTERDEDDTRYEVEDKNGKRTLVWENDIIE